MVIGRVTGNNAVRFRNYVDRGTLCRNLAQGMPLSDGAAKPDLTL